MKLNLFRILLISIVLSASSCKKTESHGKNGVSGSLKSTSSWQHGDSVVNGTYRIYTDNNLTLSTNLSLKDQSNIRLYDNVPTKGQRWKITKITGTDYYSIVNVNSGKAIDVPFGLSNTALRLWQYTAANNNAQQFKIEFQDGFYHIITKNGLALSVEGTKANEGYITQETNTGAALQQWQLEQVEENPGEQQKYFYNALLNSGADPFIYKKDGYFYYLTTTGGNISLSRKSKMSELGDVVTVVVWTPPAGTMYSKNLWAPEMFYYAPTKKWYIYFAADNGNDGNHRMHVIENSATDPTTANWVYKGQIADASNLWAIDGTVLVNAGKYYFVWSGWRTASGSNSGIQQLYIAKMSSPWTITGPRVMIAEPTYNWEKNGLVNEGPEMLKNPAGETFIVYSGSGCWTDDYKLGLLKLKTGGDPLNP
ncbi:MAG: hypothetical protein EOP51_27890, partial [Sphingobacteriales bacterium]